MSTATTYRTTVAHSRREPVTNRFRYRSNAWLVDLDHLPRLPPGLRWLASFDARDHLGSGTSLADNVRGFLRTQGAAAGGRIVMLANPRAMGHVFNPISIYWCYDPDDLLVAVLAEVHNTYGDRHAYLLRPRADGTVDQTVDKQLYVSPFNPVDGRYRITVSAPGEQVAVSVSLLRVGRPAFVATLHGRRRAARPVLAAAIATAFTCIRVSSLIRRQGIGLVLRGMRVEPRPVHLRQEAA